MSEIHDLIKVRYSPLAFSPIPVEDDKLELLFEAARWAPSSFNEQPWRFIYSKREEEEAFDNLLSCLIEPNQEWARNAGVLISIIAKKTFSRNGKDNRHALYDTGAAVNNICLQATDLNLYIRQMAGFSVEKAKAALNVPDDCECVAMLALGYLGKEDDLSEGLISRSRAPRIRKELNEIRNKNTWFD